jgi:hypothetical protein
MDVLFSRTFCPTYVMSPDVLSHRTFCPTGRFVCRHFVPPDVLSCRTFCSSGRFLPVCYVSGRYVSGRYVSGRFVWAPSTVLIAVSQHQLLARGAEYHMYLVGKSIYAVGDIEIERLKNIRRLRGSCSRRRERGEPIRYLTETDG